jgi:drug/metabolite transporter (DMT)-like permease
MYWLLLCIIFTSGPIIAFKYFGRWRVKILPVIVFNYVASTLLGALLQRGITCSVVSSASAWVIWGVLLGAGFISVYFLLNATVVRHGITVGAIANKLSVVIPVTIAILVYKEQAGMLKITGILLALISVVLTNIKTGKRGIVRAGGMLLPVAVFAGSGLCDALLNYIQRFHLPYEYLGTFTTIVFGTAFLVGMSVMVYYYITGNETFGWREVGLGLMLGLINYASMFTILQALKSPSVEDSVVWALNNVGVIVFTTIYAVLIFREPINRYNIAGILMAIFAILLITGF